MIRKIALSCGGLAIGILSFVSVAGAQYACPDGVVYQTNCSGKPQGTKCIRTTADTGCCLPGTCSGGSMSVCNIPSNIPNSVCQNDNDPCTKRACDTFPPNHNNVCSQAPDPLQENANCSAVDGNLCTIDRCNAQGVCTFQSNVDCSGIPFDPQCASGVTCTPANGNCQKNAINTGNTCNDGHDCTYGEICFNGACGEDAGAGAKRQTGACADGDYCNPGECNGTKDCVQRAPLPAGAECNFNACSIAQCDAPGGNCVFISCDETPGLTCAQCGDTPCNPSVGDHPSFPCGCGNNPPN